jgi:hypothetical protein
LGDAQKLAVGTDDNLRVLFNECIIGVETIDIRFSGSSMALLLRASTKVETMKEFVSFSIERSKNFAAR